MTRLTGKAKGIGEQMFEFLERKPENYDVTFSVGPEKTVVKAIKFVLKAASPVFEKEFDERWEISVINEGEGIPLPDLDPVVFQLFIKLLIQDNWSVNSIRLLNLSVDTLLNLLRICRRFEITKAVPNLDKIVGQFVRTFNNYKDIEEFILLLSKSNLETFFSCNELPMEEMDIFTTACRWAENQCKQSEIEVTGVNIRKILGGCLHEIRFPTMTGKEFAKACRVKNLLTIEERDSVYEFIGLDEDEKDAYDATQLHFQTKGKRHGGSFHLDLTKVFHNVTNMETACVGKEYRNFFQSNRRILLHGFGFFGPTENDSYYDITVQIKRKTNDTWLHVTEKFMQSIYGQKGKLLYFFFCHPIAIEPISDDKWMNYYVVNYSLKGPAVSMFAGSNADEKIKMADTKFRLSYFNDNKHICQLIFNKL